MKEREIMKIIRVDKDSLSIAVVKIVDITETTQRKIVHKVAVLGSGGTV